MNRFDFISSIDLSHNSILGNEESSLIGFRPVFNIKEEGININKKSLIFEGKIGISFINKTPNVVKNDMSKNLNFLIGISKINVIKTANNAFLEVVRIIIYTKAKIKIKFIDLRDLWCASIKNNPMIKDKTILNQAPE